MEFKSTKLKTGDNDVKVGYVFLSGIVLGWIGGLMTYLVFEVI